MLIEVRVKLRCAACGADLVSNSVYVQPCKCLKITPEPIRMYWDDLHQALEGRVVEVSYFKKSGDYRVLKGCLGCRCQGFDVGVPLVYFIEHIDGQKCTKSLLLRNIGTITELDSGQEYHVIGGMY